MFPTAPLERPEVQGVTKRPALLLSFLLLGAVFLPGCNDTAYPEDLDYRYEDYQSWEIAKQQMKYITIKGSKQDRITASLQPYFGTPRNPLVLMSRNAATQKEDAAVLVGEANDPRALRLDDKTLAHGSKLYRQYCLHCHGMMGSGEGATGQFLNPKPRDFRQGMFKFISTAPKDQSTGKYGTGQTSFPSRADLLRTLRNGIPTASMPAFNLLPENDLQALASYVTHLSLRGQTERDLAEEDLPANKAALKELVETKIRDNVTRWHNLSRSDFVPTPLSKPWEQLHEENMKTGRGRTLFLTTGGCVECHGKDGQSSFTEVKPNIVRRDKWGELIQPRNLSLGHFRGGSRPIDLFYRIRLGIDPSGMTPAAETLSDEDVWHIVDYVLSLPQERIAKK
jgi:mono/diheme cytochrome c family protein